MVLGLGLEGVCVLFSGLQVRLFTIRAPNSVCLSVPCRARGHHTLQKLSRRVSSTASSERHFSLLVKSPQGEGFQGLGVRP